MDVAAGKDEHDMNCDWDLSYITAQLASLINEKHVIYLGRNWFDGLKGYMSTKQLFCL